MTEWAQVRRVVIIVDTSIESLILEHIMHSGARGYNCVYCFGKGRHETLEDPFTGRSRVRIEVIANVAVAETIMDYVHEEEFASYPITAYMDAVDIHPNDVSFF